MSTKRTTLQIERSVIENAVEIAKKKYQYRPINSNAEAIREILIEFIKENEGLLTEPDHPNKAQKIPT